MDGIAFSTAEAPGALRNGTRVEKTDYRLTDTHHVGAKARVLGSLGPLPEWEGLKNVFGYFVEWEDMPGVPVFIVGNRIREVKPD
jgi:hypothetical protein